MRQRNTTQKSVIASALAQLASHPTADQVYDYLHADHPSISRATVYRVLRQMEDNGQALRVSVADGADHFDHQTHPHSHGRCVRCGKVFDVTCSLPTLSELAPVQDDRFTPTGFTLLLEGVCRECKN